MHQASVLRQVFDRFPLTQTIVSNIAFDRIHLSLFPFLIVPSALYLFRLDARLERSIFR